MNDMQRIVDLKWVPWTYASFVAFGAGVWAGNRFLTEGQYGQPAFNGSAFLLGSFLAFVATSPLVLAFYIASRMVDNQVELGARIALVPEGGASVSHVEAD